MTTWSPEECSCGYEFTGDEDWIDAEPDVECEPHEWRDE